MCLCPWMCLCLSLCLSSGLNGTAICSAHGQCLAATALCLCEASDVMGHWAGPACDRCTPGFTGLRCTLRCPGNASSGLVCSGHGTCTASGHCVCLAGHCGPACETWGAACAVCPPGTWGPRCRNACPGSGTEAGPCAGHGHCLDGPLGSGVCVCHDGYGGADCRRRCPEEAGLACAGHGVCVPENATCACDVGYAGPGCTDACPRAFPGALPCGGPSRGACRASDARCLCRPGYGGHACQNRCPRAADRVCGGHGACDALGVCVCVRGWVGSSCAACAPGLHGPNCRAPCVHGHSVGGRCWCYLGWAGDNCTVACAGGAAGPCNGHGTCSAGDGTCACDTGWAGVGCALQCPGGSSGAQCSGHGQCSPVTGACTCLDSDAHGHWAGDACQTCRTPWTGPSCTVLCPTDPQGRPCSGHGACEGALPHCQCSADAVRGYFAGALCDVCRPAYFGAACTRVCPGGAHAPCAGHGACDAGPLGTGRCRCWSSAVYGYFGGKDCGDCAGGYYGGMCTRPCPGGAADPCGGHGMCADGMRGTGECVCYADPRRGHWTGLACAECQGGYYGEQCAGACPAVSGVPCGGHGVCDAGRRGTGLCACHTNFTGAACDLPCPTAGNGQPCGGHGQCRASRDSGAAECACDRPWAGPACAACAAGFAGPSCGVVCADCGAHGTCDDGAQGTGRCRCARGWGGIGCSVQCPGGAAMLCHGHGTCREDGTCACARSAEDGHWAGADCLRCAEGYSGRMCQWRCPHGSDGRVCSGRGRCVAHRCVCSASTCGPACATTAGCAVDECAGAAQHGRVCGMECPMVRGKVCAGHGQCSARPGGAGVCLCDDAWSGPVCDIVCPGTPTTCSQHGFCDGTTEGCMCLPGFAGKDCSLQCPGGWNRPCSAHGACRDGADGDGTCACDAGYVGPACESACPGDRGRPCHGHGQCTDVRQCECDDRWTGRACDACAAGYWGPDCQRTCHRGASRDRLCVCEPHWAGLDCAQLCAGGSTAPCTGHGVCNDTRSGDGTCACAPGWRGFACAVPCPGLLHAGQPCSGHGHCLADATCRCTASPRTGYWAGPACEECQEGWAGRACAQACPRGAGGGPVCGGHGWCARASGWCECLSNGEGGFWSEDGNCTECASGYYGDSCRLQCPGAACRPCTGHGVCADGRGGSGRCACDAHWHGAACAQCAPGWYGPDCQSACPRGINPMDGSALAVCSGHGWCDDGLSGSGHCACTWSAVLGFWTGLRCDECMSSYFGLGCTRRCPGPAGQPCNAHGVCRDGRTGDGRCRCGPGWGGTACGLPCPTTTGVPCDGHGVCADAGAGGPACNCTAAADGRWEGVACERCAHGWAGPRCGARCPHARSGAVCGGHGVCVAARADRALCACAPGYAGPDCTTECPGGPWFACHGHGVCDGATGQCRCFQDPTRGFWSGPACAACAGGWSGPECSTPCPAGPEGVPCAGGACRHGVCLCPRGRCGPGCNITSGPACALLWCSVGRYGGGCARRCPGGEAAPCAGHGACVAAVYGTGLCLCDPGFAGARCSLPCPGGADAPCAGHGTCHTETAQCQCHPLYGRPDCSGRCPTGDAGLCGGHGTCNDTAAGDAGCVCHAGYAGADCSRLCPGSTATPDGAVRPCSGHGGCDPRTAACQCAAGPDGHWAGPACSACAAGYRGDGCAAACVHGTTQGRRCACAAGFTGAGCELRCPGPPGTPCHGHGNCRADARCTCAPDYYGEDCRAFCRPEHCFASAPPGHPRPHAQCNAVTGVCECQRDHGGHWQGRWCSECLVGYWGEACELVCECSGHGGCGVHDGVCACFRDPDRGYWAGDACGSCEAGYLPPECRVRDVALARAGQASLPSTHGIDIPGAIVVDEDYGLAYAGGRPLWVLRSADGARLEGPALAGVVRGGAVLPDGVALWVQDPGTGALAMEKISRGPSPVRLRPAEPRPAASKSRAQGQGGPEPFHMVFACGGLLHWAALPRGTLTITSYTPAFRRVGELRVGPPTLHLDSVRRGVLWAHPSGPALLLAGARAGGWALVMLRLPGFDGLTDLAAAIPVPGCGGRCGVPAGVACLGDRLVLVFEHATALRLVRVALPSLRNVSVASVHAATLGWLGAGVRVTAAGVDPHLGALFLAAHAPQQPSVVYKIRVDTLTVYGLNRFLSHGRAPERVRGFATDERLRQLFALCRVADRTLVVRLVLYAVTRLEPPLSDARGGALVRVFGEGLPNDPRLRCTFAGTHESPTSWVSPAEVRCVAPPWNSTGAGTCAGDVLELALPGGSTANRVRLRRPPTPAVLRARPAAGPYRRPQWVLVSGHGLEPSGYLRCLFHAEGLRVAVSGARVSYVSPEALWCLRPAVRRPFRGHVDVSLDGQTYSQTRTRYDAIGDPVGLRVPDETRAPAIPAAPVTRLPPVTVRTVDANGLDVGPHGGQSHVVTAALVPVGGGAAVPLRNATARTRAGQAVLGGVVVAPGAGPYVLRLTAPGLDGAQLPILIRSGRPAALYVIAQPSGVTDNVHVLVDQPVCGLQVLGPGTGALGRWGPCGGWCRLCGCRGRRPLLG